MSSTELASTPTTVDYTILNLEQMIDLSLRPQHINFNLLHTILKIISEKLELHKTLVLVHVNSNLPLPKYNDTIIITQEPSEIYKVKNGGDTIPIQLDKLDLIKLEKSHTPIDTIVKLSKNITTSFLSVNKTTTIDTNTNTDITTKNNIDIGYKNKNNYHVTTLSSSIKDNVNEDDDDHIDTKNYNNNDNIKNIKNTNEKNQSIRLNEDVLNDLKTLRADVNYLKENQKIIHELQQKLIDQYNSLDDRFGKYEKDHEEWMNAMEQQQQQQQQQQKMNIIEEENQKIEQLKQQQQQQKQMKNVMVMENDRNSDISSIITSELKMISGKTRTYDDQDFEFTQHEKKTTVEEKSSNGTDITVDDDDIEETVFDEKEIIEILGDGNTENQQELMKKFSTTTVTITPASPSTPPKQLPFLENDVEEKLKNQKMNADNLTIENVMPIIIRESPKFKTVTSKDLLQISNKISLIGEKTEEHFIIIEQRLSNFDNFIRKEKMMRNFWTCIKDSVATLQHLKPIEKQQKQIVKDLCNSKKQIEYLNTNFEHFNRISCLPQLHNNVKQLIEKESVHMKLINELNGCIRDVMEWKKSIMEDIGIVMKRLQTLDLKKSDREEIDHLMKIKANNDDLTTKYVTIEYFRMIEMDLRENLTKGLNQLDEYECKMKKIQEKFYCELDQKYDKLQGITFTRYVNCKFDSIQKQFNEIENDNKSKKKKYTDSGIMNAAGVCSPIIKDGHCISCSVEADLNPFTDNVKKFHKINKPKKLLNVNRYCGGHHTIMTDNDKKKLTRRKETKESSSPSYEKRCTDYKKYQKLYRSCNVDFDEDGCNEDRYDDDYEDVNSSIFEHRSDNKKNEDNSN